MLPRTTFPRIALALAVSGAVVVMSAALVLSPASAGPVANGPAEEMLQDGRNAIDDDRPDIAAKIFETLRATYPGTAESVAAEKELSRLTSKGTMTSKGTLTSKGTMASEGSTVSEKSIGDVTQTRRDDVRPADRAPVARFVSAKEREEQLRRLSMNFLTEVGDRVFFAENSASIGGRARGVIEAQARWLKSVPGLEVTIIGRADDGTSEGDASRISEERAKAVEAMLVGNGVAAVRIKIEARGMRDPIATCASPLCQAQNRHAESLLRYPAAGARLSDGEGNGTSRPGCGRSPTRRFRALSRPLTPRTGHADVGQMPAGGAARRRRRINLGWRPSSN